MPAQQAPIDTAYQAALATIADSPAKAAGIDVGRKAAAAVLAMRADDTVAGADTYRPHTTPGAYVPTAAPAATQWPQRKPWLMTSASQFRPAAPPALTSEAWAREYNEVKAIGGKTSTRRSAEQTEIARFWEYSLPPIYHGVVRSVANMPGRETTQNARLFAAVTQAQDDAMIAIFDAKYHYNFWRPVTAIRSGDIDGNDATERDASWAPFIDVAAAPGVSERAQHPRGRHRRRAAGRDRQRRDARVDDDEPEREGCDASLDEGRRLRAGGRRRTRLPGRALPLLDQRRRRDGQADRRPGRGEGAARPVRSARAAQRCATPTGRSKRTPTTAPLVLTSLSSLTTGDPP